MTRPALALLLVAALAGCDASGPDDGPPDVIAPAAFSVDLDAFPDEASADAAGASAVGANYATSAARVGIVSAILGANLALPERATRAATRVEPTVTDGAYLWDTNVDVFGRDVEVRLAGDPDGDRVAWRLTTALEGDDRFTYYTAETTASGQAGSWRLFNPDADGPVLAASFDVDETPEITFTVPPGNDQAGARVRYEADGDALTFDFTDAAGDRALVVWDRATGAGSITADDYNGGERACWDADRDDTDC